MVASRLSRPLIWDTYRGVHPPHEYVWDGTGGIPFAPRDLETITIVWTDALERLEEIASIALEHDPRTPVIRSLGLLAEVRLGRLYLRSIQGATGGVIEDMEDGVSWIDSWWDRFRIRPSFSLPSSAVRLWRSTLTEPIPVDPEPLPDCHRALAGGYAFVLDTRPHEHIETWDIRSAYGAVMRDERFPTGRARRITREKPGRPCIYYARWQSPPDIRLPILPLRLEDGALAWVRGRGEGWITAPEVEYAREVGYEVEVAAGWEWEDWCAPFGRFVSLVEEARQDPWLAETAKLLPPMLYGRFAVPPLGLEVFRPRSKEDLEGGEAVDSEGRVWKRRTDYPERLRHPVWAAYIAAHQRITLHRAAMSIGPERIICGHTDSLTLPGGIAKHHLTTGETFGTWRCARRYSIYRALSATTGIGRDAETGTWLRRGNPPRKTPTQLLRMKLTDLRDDTILSGVRCRRSHSPSWRLLPDGTTAPYERDDHAL